MISQTVEYALRAIVTIAQQNGESCTARQISKITQVPGPYLSKLMQGLVRAGLTKSQRGLHGGFVLTKEPAKMSILEIVNAVEPIRRIHECPLGLSTHGRDLCPLHRRLDQAMEIVEKIFRDTTVADVLAEPGSVTPLCEETKVIMINGSSAEQPSAPKKSRN